MIRDQLTKHDTSKCDKRTQANPEYCLLSREWKKITPQKVCSSMKHSVVTAEVKKNSVESPLRPTVPGPAESARTLTKEKEPLISPNPKPETESRFSKGY